MHHQGFETGNDNSKAEPSLLSEAHTPVGDASAPAQVKRGAGASAPAPGTFDYESLLTAALERFERMDRYSTTLRTDHCPRKGEYVPGARHEVCAGCIDGKNPMCSWLWPENEAERVALVIHLADTRLMLWLAARGSDHGDDLCIVTVAIYAAEKNPGHEAQIVTEAISLGLDGDWLRLLIDSFMDQIEQRDRYAFVREISDAIGSTSPRHIERVTGIPKSVVSRALRAR